MLFPPFVGDGVATPVAEAAPLALALAEALILTPTLSQSCCAKALTSAREVRVVSIWTPFVPIDLVYQEKRI